MIGRERARIGRLLGVLDSALAPRLWRARVAVSMSILCAFVLSSVSQVQELYVDFRDSWIYDPLRLTLITAALALLGVTLSISASIGASTGRREHPRPGTLADTLVQIGVSFVAFLGALVGIAQYLRTRLNDNFLHFNLVVHRLGAETPTPAYLAALPTEVTAEGFVHTGSVQAMILMTCVVALMIAALFPSSHRRIDGWFHGARSQASSRRLFIGSIAVTGALVVVFASINVPVLSEPALSVTRGLGALPILLVFLSLLTVHLTGLVAAGAKRGYSLLFFLLLAIPLFSAMGWSENHGLRAREVSPAERHRAGVQEASPAVASSPLPMIDEAFADWYARRPAAIKQRFSGRPYPVFIVAAEGGGAYAAAQAAIFLARLYDECPAISHHLFAVSAVSGGSVGASIVAALVDRLSQSAEGWDTRCDLAGSPSRGAYEQVAKELLKVDHLSPVIATGLFPDLLQRILPFPVAVFDRARALEYSLEQSWAEKLGPGRNPFAANFRDLWDSGGRAPMLLLNTTSVEHGVQKVIAPVTSLDYSQETRLHHFESFFAEHVRPGSVRSTFDIPLSTAAGLSARFPGISPPGYVVDPAGSLFMAGRSHSFVDGAYTDNSGVETALRVLKVLELFVTTGLRAADGFDTIGPPTGPFAFELIVIGGQSRRSPYKESRTKLDAFAAPVLALLNGRENRGARAVDLARESKPSLMQVSLPWNFVDPPFGWKLTPRVVDVVGASIGDARRCVAAPGPFAERPRILQIAQDALPRDAGSLHQRVVGEFFEMYGILNDNHCVAARILLIARGMG